LNQIAYIALLEFKFDFMNLNGVVIGCDLALVKSNFNFTAIEWLQDLLTLNLCFKLNR